MLLWNGRCDLCGKRMAVADWKKDTGPNYCSRKACTPNRPKEERVIMDDI